MSGEDERTLRLQARISQLEAEVADLTEFSRMAGAEMWRLRRDRHMWKARLAQKHRHWISTATAGMNIAFDKVAVRVELRERCEATDALVLAARDRRHLCGIEAQPRLCDDCVDLDVCTAYDVNCCIEDFFDEHPIFCDDPYDCSTCRADDELDEDEELPS